MPKKAEGGEHPRFHGRRRGKTLRRGPRELIETLLPRLAVAAPEPGAVLDPRTLFAAPVRAVWLEIGFGGGEHAAAQAQAHPDVGLLACEVFVNGIASLLGHIDRAGIESIRIWPEDVRRLFPALPDAAFERIFVLFPDPWPKTRHADRRFIGPENLDTLARLLADGGELRVASDDEIYVQWAVKHLTAHPAFQWSVETLDDARIRPPEWPPTRYETKALRQGRHPAYLSFRRVPRGAASAEIHPG